MRGTFVKRRYFDMRLGGTQVSPIIQMANFAMISFLYIRNYMEIEIFAPLFMISGFIVLAYIGVRYRKHQATTDWDMIFEKQTQQSKVLYQIMLALEKNQPQGIEFYNQLEYVKRVSEGKI